MARVKMSSVDQSWLRMDSPQNLMMIVGIQVYKTPLPHAVLKNLLVQRLLKFRRFKQKVETDAAGAWWVDDRAFDLDQHLVVTQLPAPGSDAQMQDFTAQLASTPLDPERPLWQFHLVQGFNGSNALVARIHHCIADGIALVAVTLSLTDSPIVEASGVPEQQEPQVESNPYTPYLKPITKSTIKAINASSSMWTKSVEIAAHPDKLVDYAQIGSQVLKDAAKIALMPDDSPTRLKGNPGVTKRVAWAEPLPLAPVKAVSRLLNCSVNDVLLSCVAGALRQYLRQHGDNTFGCEVRAMVPVNLRPLKDALKLGNRFGLVPLELPVGMANPIARLQEVQRRMDALKGGYQALLAYAVLGVVGMAPRQLQTQVLDMLSRKATAVMTNVPGPQQPITIGGVEISRLLFWVPQSGSIGLGVSILSYNGAVQFGVISDSTLTPHPQAIIDQFIPEFERLLDVLTLLPKEVLLSPELDADAVQSYLFGSTV
jgi:diacylglycerol O-acyltransferase / wax synthase